MARKLNDLTRKQLFRTILLATSRETILEVEQFRHGQCIRIFSFICDPDTTYYQYYSTLTCSILYIKAFLANTLVVIVDIHASFILLTSGLAACFGF
jgi:hypothetical protein